MRLKLGIWAGLFINLFLILGSNSASSGPRSEALLLYNAIETGDLEEARKLLNSIDVNYQDSLGYTALYKSVFFEGCIFSKLIFFSFSNLSKFFKIWSGEG